MKKVVYIDGNRLSCHYKDKLYAITYEMCTSPGRIQLSKKRDPYGAYPFQY